MYKGLYKLFKHWFHGGQVYFYSDPHFNDEDMKYLRKDYIGDDEQVKRINSKIGKHDTLVILGDVGDLSYVKKLRGYKVLIMGNHDTGVTKYEEYFDEVYEGILVISEKIVLSHEPLAIPHMLNLHGHVHGKVETDKMHMNLSAEFINYTPISLKSIIESGRTKFDSIHRVGIDKRAKRKHS